MAAERTFFINKFLQRKRKYRFVRLNSEETIKKRCVDTFLENTSVNPEPSGGNGVENEMRGMKRSRIHVQGDP
jgi:hypothetical protein